jgi:hypothetical protein
MHACRVLSDTINLIFENLEFDPTPVINPEPKRENICPLEEAIRIPSRSTIYPS